MIRVDVWLPDPASVIATGAFGAGALVRLERAASIGGAYTEVSTQAVVATTFKYTFWDATGTASSFYRWRVSKSDGTSPSDYSPSFPGTIPAGGLGAQAYAPLDRVLRLFSSPPATAHQLTRLAELLVTATQQLIEACGGRDYFLHPNDSVATAWYETLPHRGRPGRFDDRGILHVHDGIVSLDQLEVSLDQGSSYQVVTAGDYVLRGENPWSDAPVPTGEPYFHLALTGLGTTVAFPRGTNVIRPTGVRGWPAVPEALVEATAERARQLAFAEGSYSGGQAGGEDQYGNPAPTDRFWPQAAWNFIQRQASRFDGCRA